MQKLFSLWFSLKKNQNKLINIILFTQSNAVNMYGYLRFTFEYFMKKFLFIKQSEKFHKLFCVLKINVIFKSK